MGIISNLMFAVGFKVSDNGLRGAEDQISNLTLGVIGFGVAAGAALAGFATASIHAASQFETAMSKVQMATGATQEEMNETREIAKDLYSQNLGEDWNDLGNALTLARQITQQTGDELQRTTRDAILLRDTFQLELNESLKTSDTMVKNFGISSADSFNLFAQGAQKGLDKSGELLDSANEYSPHFKSLGFSANEMFDTFASGLEGGAFNLDKVGDAVKEFNIRSKDGSKGSIEAFEMLGLNAEEMMSTFARGGPEAKKAFTQIMQMITDVEDPVARNTIGVGLMGTQFEDLEAGVIAAMATTKSQFDMTQESMEALNEIKFNKPGEAFAMFGRQLEVGILIPVGEKLLPYFNQFGQWMADHQPQIKAVGDAIGDGFGAAITFVNEAIGFLIKHIDIIGPALTGFALVISYALLPAFTAWITAQWAAAMAGWAAIAPWLPFIAIGIAVAAVIAGIIYAFNNWGTISDWLVQKWSEFKQWTIGIFNSVADFFGEWGPTILVLLAGPIAWIIAFITNNWDQIKAYTVAAFTSIWDSITGVWTSIIGFLSGINLFDIGKNIIEGMINGISSMATALVDRVKSLGDSITNQIKEILGIHSPSRVMMELGFYTGEGLALGIEGTESRIADASSGLADQISLPQTYEPSKEFESLNIPVSNGLFPATAPAVPTTGAASTGPINIEIPITIEVNGGTSGETVGNEIAAQIKPVIQEVIESTFRRMGIMAVSQ
ncbi:phage tail tape measure protein [Brevibacillus reuszeri]|uniref:phage tail tape measure protein n=1 Tax=Brevibacillus reuszeri TaxID=54915 RepID=UPI00289A9C43|nr:phage tail tape measure protein [Brevibacillus reuszeri]